MVPRKHVREEGWLGGQSDASADTTATALPLLAASPSPLPPPAPHPCHLRSPPPPCRSYFNIYNKQVLKAFPHPLTITALQFAIGSLIACTMWLLGLHKRPEGGLEAVRLLSPQTCCRRRVLLIKSVDMATDRLALSQPCAAGPLHKQAEGSAESMRHGC